MAGLQLRDRRTASSLGNGFGGGIMKVGDLITHNPTGAVGTIVEDNGHSVYVVWCVDPMNGMGGMGEFISKIFIEVVKK